MISILFIKTLTITIGLNIKSLVKLVSLNYILWERFYAEYITDLILAVVRLLREDINKLVVLAREALEPIKL